MPMPAKPRSTWPYKRRRRHPCSCPDTEMRAPVVVGLAIARIWIKRSQAGDSGLEVLQLPARTRRGEDATAPWRCECAIRWDRGEGLLPVGLGHPGCVTILLKMQTRQVEFLDTLDIFRRLRLLRHRRGCRRLDLRRIVVNQESLAVVDQNGNIAA